MKEGSLVVSTHLENERVGVVFIVVDEETVMVRWQDRGFPVCEAVDVCCLEKMINRKEEKT